MEGVIISTSGRETSKRRYEALLSEVGLKEKVSYHTFDVSGEQDAPLFAEKLRSGCIGGAISKGIKASIIRELDLLDESAEQVQSVNTVVVEKETGKLKGFNTDYMGFQHAISEAMVALKGDKGQSIDSAVIYGYGGVTLVVVQVLRKLGISSDMIFITGRNADKAKLRAEELGVRTWENASTRSVDLFVNASPVTDSDLANAEGFLPALEATQCAVFDHEMPGQKLRDYVGEKGDLTYISGFDMYIPQSIMQWTLFLATRVSGDKVASTLSALFKTENQ